MAQGTARKSYGGVQIWSATYRDNKTGAVRRTPIYAETKLEAKQIARTCCRPTWALVEVR